MKASVFVARCFIATVLLFGFSKAEDVATTGKTASKLSLEEAKNYLTESYMNFFTTWFKINPDSIENELYVEYMNLIKNDTEVSSLKTSIKQIWPTFWKVFKRRACGKLFNDKLRAIVKDVSKTILDSMKEQIAETRRMAYKTDEDLLSKREECFKDSEKCTITDESKESLEKAMKTVQNEVDRVLTNLKLAGKEKLKEVLETSVIKPVKECLAK